MLCNICAEREATIFIKKIINGVKTEYNICTQCSSKFEDQTIDHGQLTKSDLLGSLGEMISGLGQRGAGNIDTEKNCTVCDYSISTFYDTGRFGCPDCYPSFKMEINKILNSLQGSMHHSGKSPQRMKSLRKISELQAELQEAVNSEEYERAAVLRDKIRAMKNGTED